MFTARTLTVGAVAATVALAASACGSSTADDDAADWTPSKPIEMIAPAATGGGWDTLARTTGRLLEENDLIDQQMRVVNKPGAGGAIGWAYIANNAGDPHKLFVTSPPILLVPLSGASDHDHTDFTPIARLATDAMAFMVAEDSPYESIEDVVEALRDDPSSVSVAGGSSPGSMDHVAAAGAFDAAGVDASQLNYVAFDGGGEATTALLGGHVDLAVSGAGESTGLVDGGKVRVLAVSSPEQVPVLPDAPTLQDAGIDYTFDIWRGVMGPADLTDTQVSYYESAYQKLSETEAWQTEMEKYGWVDSFQGSEDFGTFLDEQQAEFEDILTDVGLR
ncbi:tripartite tricarboxylate transporter substrate binding protein [Nocardioides sp.]|uniref:Bug family tripartite tricarboxylate transporter substrate binding protein n=1 Tax=Nocardioides sp. TaxID=35761 RepID=UPI002732A714|nr:tripartite tricarboxylate transporter substrate binding protein [Nocardioides sp.]MDP3890997.1 tripartite tricarboxylate transporter substrate binding protein [Nocardioides sp.]